MITIIYEEMKEETRGEQTGWELNNNTLINSCLPSPPQFWSVGSGMN